MQKAYSRINWENYPSDNTPINETNLNSIDTAVDELDNRIITLETVKATKAEVATLVQSVEFEESTGIFKITKKNGSILKIDTKLEKIAVNFSYDSTTQQIILTLIDGTKQYINLSALITQFEFVDTETIGFDITPDGKVKATVLDGSITEDKLQPNFLADIKVEVAKAQESEKTAETFAKDSENFANKSKQYAIGESDSSKHYYEQTKKISESLSGALRPMGTVAFANLPPLSSASEGDMYNISNQFTTTSSFEEGEGNIVPAGSNIFKTINGLWDILGGIPVVGVKGNAESDYRRGNVNITPANIGLGNVNNTADADKSVKSATTATEVRGNKVAVWSDDEGGNVRIISPDGTKWEMDAYNNNLRIFCYTDDGWEGIVLDKEGNVGAKTFNGITQWASINGKPSSYPPSSHTHSQYYDSTLSRPANTVLAAPNGSAGKATFRKLVAADLPGESYFSGVHIGSSASAIPYIYTEGNNINFRYVDASGNTTYTNIRSIVSALNSHTHGSHAMELISGTSWYKHLCADNYTKEMSARVQQVPYAFTNAYGNMYFANFTITVPNFMSYFASINITPWATTGSGALYAVITSFTATSISGYLMSPVAETKTFSLIVHITGY